MEPKGPKLCGGESHPFASLAARNRLLNSPAASPASHGATSAPCGFSTLPAARLQHSATRFTMHCPMSIMYSERLNVDARKAHELVSACMSDAHIIAGDLASKALVDFVAFAVAAFVL